MNDTSICGVTLDYQEVGLNKLSKVCTFLTAESFLLMPAQVQSGYDQVLPYNDIIIIFFEALLDQKIQMSPLCNIQLV